MTTPAEAVQDEIQIEGMSVDDFMRRYEQAPFELIHGEIIAMSPVRLWHDDISKRAYDLLFLYERATKSGSARRESPYILPNASRKNWVKGSRVPDVAFVTGSRLTEYRASHPDWRKYPMALVPDLVMEVISPTDSYTKIANKVKTYLEDGVRLILVFDPDERSVVVHAPGQAPVVLTENDTLTGDDVLPGFSVKVSQFFED